MPHNRDNEGIPGPTPLPVLGNLLDFPSDNSTDDLLELGKKYFTFGGQTEILVNSVELVNELCDESRFVKVLGPALEQLRTAAGAGLFTAYDGEHEWETGHQILAPVFGPTKIRDMFDHMFEMAEQLGLKWERCGSAHEINVSDDFSRVTLDTIALCGMGFRFNSFYRDGTFHPFINSMTRWLKTSDQLSSTPKMISKMFFRLQRDYRYDVQLMRETCASIIQARQKDTSAAHNDLLFSLMEGVDQRTGEHLSDSSISNNLITFLIAGHETTAGLLSFAFYYLTKNIEIQRKARQEVDKVFEAGGITVASLSKLRYISALLKETLRLMPTAPSWAVGARKDEVIGGKYHLKKGQPVHIILSCVHRDPGVWGSTADQFIPERMFDENIANLPPNAWKPFGNGKRGCIGRAFAWQEALLITAYLIHKFDFMLCDESYQLKIQESLTIKPKDCKIFAVPRISGPRLATVSTEPRDVLDSVDKLNNHAIDNQGGSPVLILYGSDSGTCEAVARQLARDLDSRGSHRCTLANMDSYAGRLPNKQPILIVTGSYDGNPPSNAAEFVKWLHGLEESSLKEVSFAVFGCGHKDWHTTFFKVPKLIDQLMEQYGGKRVAPPFLVDTATEDAILRLEDWEAHGLSHGLGLTLNAPHTARPLIVLFRDPPNARKEYFQCQVRTVQLLTASESRKKIHIELELPVGVQYSVGYSVSILPINPKSTVQRALSRFHLAWDTYLKIESDLLQDFPTEYPISVADLLGAFVELSQTASVANIKSLADATDDVASKAGLLGLAGNEYPAEIAAKHVSLLDLLEQFPAVQIPIEAYLGMVPLMRPRIYSIANTPGWTPGRLSIVVSVLDEPHWRGSGRFLGAASNHLFDLIAGTSLRLSVKKTNPYLQPPEDPSAYPIVMIAAGSGIAPFMGFIQMRALQSKDGKRLSPALLFFGCRSPEDDLYRAELDQFEADSVVQVRRAYSRMSSCKEAQDCRHVQNRISLEADCLKELWARGGRIYVCGSMRMAEGVRSTLQHILFGSTGAEEGPLQAPRYVAEIFA